MQMVIKTSNFNFEETDIQIPGFHYVDSPKQVGSPKNVKQTQPFSPKFANRPLSLPKLTEKIMPEIRNTSNSGDALNFDTLQAVSLTKQHRQKNNIQMIKDSIPSERKRRLRY